jgi:glycosyltransferase involved in cell wall biosynthesis
MISNSPPPFRSRRVLHVIDSLDLGGAQTVLLNLASALPAHGWHMEVAAMHGRGMFAEPLQELGATVHSLSPSKWIPAYLWNFPRLLASQRYDVLHFHLFGSNWIAKPLAALVSRSPRVNHDHCNDHFRHRKLAALWLDALTNRLSDQVIAVSESTRDFLLAHEDLPSGRVRLQHNTVDCSLFQPPTPSEKLASRRLFHLPENALIVGGIGRLVPQKNFPLWLRVAAAVRAQIPEVRFFVAGEGPLEEELQDYARQLGLEDCLLWGGLVRDRVALLQALDVFLLTSDFEGLPMTILEAMASGCPIVSSSVDGMAEILVSEKDALLCPPGDASSFVHALRRILENRDLADRLADAARLKAETQFSHERQAAELAGIYDALLRQRQGENDFLAPNAPTRDVSSTNQKSS